MKTLMRSVLTATLGVAVALAGGAAAGAEGGAARPAEATVGCDAIVLRARSGTEDGFRVLLGAVSVPGERHLAGAAVRVRGREWPFYRNAGLAVRAGTPDVTVSVPEGWSDRVALSWGGSPRSGTLRFAACEGDAARSWNAYPGGLYLRRAGDCVPLLVRVGGTSTTVRIGVGRSCGRG